MTAYSFVQVVLEMPWSMDGNAIGCHWDISAVNFGRRFTAAIVQIATLIGFVSKMVAVCSAHTCMKKPGEYVHVITRNTKMAVRPVQCAYCDKFPRYYINRIKCDDRILLHGACPKPSEEAVLEGI